MKVTNKLGMPDAAYFALCSLQGLERGSNLNYIGVSSLLGAPLVRFLKNRHWDEIEIDASDTMNALQGTLAHLLFEKAAKKYPDRFRPELYLKATIENFNLRGVADLYDAETATLHDAKFKQVNSVTAGKIRGDDYLEKQLNVYAWMATQMGYPVKRLQGDVFINGWVVYKAMEHDSAYPKHPYIKMDIPLWPTNTTEAFIIERLKIHDTKAIRALKAHNENQFLPTIQEVDNLICELPICTPEERYQKKETYAVMKKGRKSALRVFPTVQQAVGYQNTADGVTYIETRPGGNMRCIFYCDVRGFCPYKNC